MLTQGHDRDRRGLWLGTLAVLLLVVGAFVILQYGVGLWRDSESRFLAKLREIPLVQANDLWVIGFINPGLAPQHLDECSRLNLDVLAMYAKSPSNSDLRLSLAYLLLVSENSAYLDYVSANMGEMRSSSELGLWRSVLLDDEHGLSGDYIERIVVAMEGIDFPYCKIAAAERRLAEGREDEKGVRYLLSLAAEREGPWWLYAQNVLSSLLPPARRASVLRSFMEEESCEGAVACCIIAMIPSERQAAEKVLRRLKESDDDKVATIADRGIKNLE